MSIQPTNVSRVNYPCSLTRVWYIAGTYAGIRFIGYIDGTLYLRGVVSDSDKEAIRGWLREQFSKKRGKQ